MHKFQVAKKIDGKPVEIHTYKTRKEAEWVIKHYADKKAEMYMHLCLTGFYTRDLPPFFKLSP